MNTPSICPFSKRDHWPKPVVLASSSTSISSKWNILPEFFISYTNTTTSALTTTLSSMMHGSNVPKIHVGKRVCTIINDNINNIIDRYVSRMHYTHIDRRYNTEYCVWKWHGKSTILIMFHGQVLLHLTDNILYISALKYKEKAVKFWNWRWIWAVHERYIKVY